MPDVRASRNLSASACLQRHPGATHIEILGNLTMRPTPWTCRLVILAILLAGCAGVEMAPPPHESLAVKRLLDLQRIAGLGPRALPADASPDRTKQTFADTFAETFCQDCSSEERARVVERVLAWNLKGPAIPTAYSDPTSYWYLSYQAQQIQAAAAALGYTVPHAVVLGELPTACINAMAIPVEGTDEKLVVVKTGLWMLASRVAALATGLLRLLDPEKQLSDDAIIPLVDALKRLLVETLVGLQGGSGIKGRPINVVHAMILSDAATLFVVGHEYAHIILRHVSDERRRVHLALTQPLAPDSSAPIVEAIARSRSEELAADRLAMSLMIQALKSGPEPESTPVAIWGPVILFSWMAIVEDALDLISEPRVPPDTSTHPTAEERLHLSAAMVRESGHQSQLDVDQLVERGFRILWESSRKVWPLMKSRISPHLTTEGCR